MPSAAFSRPYRAAVTLLALTGMPEIRIHDEKNLCVIKTERLDVLQGGGTTHSLSACPLVPTCCRKKKVQKPVRRYEPHAALCSGRVEKARCWKGPLMLSCGQPWSREETATPGRTPGQHRANVRPGEKIRGSIVESRLAVSAAVEEAPFPSPRSQVSNSQNHSLAAGRIPQLHAQRQSSC